MVQCENLVCTDRASGLVRLNVLNYKMQVERRDIPMCNDHADLAEIWTTEGSNPHVTEEGHLYIGELDELIKRKYS